MCCLTLFSLYTSDLIKKCRNCVLKTCFRRGFEFIKKNVFIKKMLIINKNLQLPQNKNSYKNLRTNISFILELWYQHRIIIVEITHKIRISFKTLASRKASFVLELWYQHRIIIVEITHEIRISFKHWFQGKQQYGGTSTVRVTINLESNVFRL